MMNDKPKPKPKPKPKMTNLETVQALDAVVDKLLLQSIELCDPDNWPQVDMEDPDNPTPMERVQQLATNSACAKQASLLAKLTQSLSNVAENRRRQITAKNANKPERGSDVTALIASATERAMSEVQQAQLKPAKKVH